MTGVAKHFILARDERGSVAIMFTLILVPMMGAIGIAVDGARWYSARQVTSGAIDLAVLAGARLLQVDPDNADAALASAANVYTANTAGRGRVRAIRSRSCPPTAKRDLRQGQRLPQDDVPRRRRHHRPAARRRTPRAASPKRPCKAASTAAAISKSR